MRIGLREILFFLVLVAMPTAAYFFVFEPRNAQIVEAEEEIQAKQNKLRQLDAATQSMLDLGTEIDKLTEAIEMFEQKLPAQQEVEVILKEVWEVAARHDLTPRSVRTDKINATAQYAELPIKMLIIGGFDGFYNFLIDLERLPRITRMPEMRMKKIENNQGDMEAELILSIFFEGNKTNNTEGRRS